MYTLHPTHASHRWSRQTPQPFTPASGPEAGRKSSGFLSLFFNVWGRGGDFFHFLMRGSALGVLLKIRGGGVREQPPKEKRRSRTATLYAKKESGFTATSEETPSPSNSEGSAVLVISRSCASCSQLST